ncbi:MAG: T9SS type A sorting domain-containing protein [Taibaiella sp.]|nr:T9SS type A sorting domain-containing protein [Taibaiella sp.]
MRPNLLLIFLLCVSGTVAFAQQGRVKTYTTPLAGSVILGDIEDKYAAMVYNLEMPEPDANAEQQKLKDIKNQIQQMYPYKRNAIPNDRGYRKTSVPMPLLITGYVSDSIAGIPPDNDMAVNNSDTTVTVMNSYVAIQNSTTGKVLGFHKSLYIISKSVALDSSIDFRYDPKIIYDPEQDKFILMMLNATNARNYIVVGFSNSNNPFGTWNFYKFYGNYANDTTWFDFPSVAITHNEFFFTGNKIHFDTTWQAGFRESVIYQIKKQDGYAGKPVLTYQIWDSIKYNGKFVRNLYPVKGGASIQGPDQYFLSNRNFDIRNDSVFLIRITDTIGSLASLSVNVLKSPIRYGVPPDGRQPDTAAVLATNDARILGAFREGTEIQFTSTTKDTVNGAAAIMHGVIANYKTAPSLSARLLSIDTLDFGYPNLSYTASTGTTNQSIISFDYTGPHTYPGLGAIFFDGAQYSDMLKIKGGDSSINIFSIGHEQRWGDYSGSQPSWKSLGTVWVNGIYGRSAKNYGCYIAKLKSPTNVSVPTEKIPVSTNTLYPNPSSQFIKLEFNIEKEMGITFIIYDMQGRVVDKVIHTYCREGKNIIQFNTSSLSAGNYFLKGMDDHGTQVTINKFLKK